MESIALFGQFFKKMRQRSGLTLRQFCLQHGLDPGNISRLERGKALPPHSREKLEHYAKILGVEKYSDNWYSFFDLAATCSGKIPDDVMSDEELVKKLPLVFRTLRGQKPTTEELDSLTDIIRRS